MAVSELKGVMIGAGYFAQFQAEGWNRIPGAKIVAVADALAPFGVEANELPLTPDRLWVALTRAAPER